MIRTEPARGLSSSRSRRRPALTSLVIALAAVLVVAGFSASALARSAASPPPAKPLAAKPSAAKPPALKPPVTPAAVPPGFVGVDADSPLFDPADAVDFGQQTKVMVADGVQSLRVAFNWAAAQPYANFNDVPTTDVAPYTNVGGVPTDFAFTDALVSTAAKAGLTVLPTILYAPGWDATPNRQGVDTPAQPGPYAAYAAALVGRYGPHGSFWSSNSGIPRHAIRLWQVWNEPNIAYYWHQPFGPGYTALLRAAHGAIKRADPGAQVVLGALTNAAWTSLGQLRGDNGLFDVAAVNGFTKQPANVIVYLQLMRRAMNHLGEAKKPLLATELSWPSAAGQHTSQPFDFNVTQRGQARNIAALLPLLGQYRQQLGLIGFYWYTWIGDESPGHHVLAFDYAGLEGYSNGRTFAKPALAAFKQGALALEHCRRKGIIATQCAAPVAAPHRPTTPSH